MKNALEGIKVLDVSQVIAAPTCARHLADFGADVIHVENAKSGDFWRNYLKDVGGTTAVPSEIDYNWEIFNRNKKGIALDLSQKDGQQILYKMVESADVFITNLRMFEREKFACSYKHLKAINPKIIYGSVTGFGSKGPEHDAPAFDQTAYWYRSGVTYVLLPPGVPNIGFRAGFGDTVAGLGLFGGVMTALFTREKLGVGQEVEISLLGTGMYQLSFDISGALATGKDFQDMYAEKWDPNDPIMAERSRLTSKVASAYDELWEHWKSNSPNPLAGAYLTKDKRIIFMNVLQPERYWTKVCRALNIEHVMTDDRFINHENRIANHKDLYLIVKEAFSKLNLEEMYPRLIDNGVPFAVQRKLSEVIQDPQARDNDYFIKFEHPEHGQIEILASPLKLSATPASYRLPAPQFSQHTEETLLGLGYSWEDIAKFKENRIIP
jgi:crotonobetainyl-CoA:carnitine CoA-transferase CaiB-like acyl-CoA transferase